MDCQKCRLAEKRFREESALAMAERTIRRLWITIIILIVLMASMCVGFFAYEVQFEDYSESTEIEAEQQGDYNFVAGGDLNYGAEGQGQTDSQGTGEEK